MSITVDFVLFFLLIVFPGLLFKRFYFWGEFSKEFTVKGTVYKSIIYSIIPGILIQIIASLIYLKSHDESLRLDDIICLYKEVTNPGNFAFSEFSEYFIEDGISRFLLHQLIVLILSIFLGLLAFFLVRKLKLDVKFKVLRFKNQWYYIFSGEIRFFKKFVNAHNWLTEINGKANKYKFYPPYVDILLDNNGKSELYSGYVVDYDLDYENINDLDQIYLMGPNRWRLIKSGYEKAELKNKGFLIRGEKVKVPIPGDVFVLDAKKILNMNLTYIPYEYKQEKEVGLQRLYQIGIGIGILTGIFFFVILIYKAFSVNDDLFLRLLNLSESLSFWSTSLLVLSITQLISLAMPSIVELSRVVDNTKENLPQDIKEDILIRKYEGMDILWKFLMFLFFFIIFLIAL